MKDFEGFRCRCVIASETVSAMKAIFLTFVVLNGWITAVVDSYAYMMLLNQFDYLEPNNNGCLHAMVPSGNYCGAQGNIGTLANYSVSIVRKNGFLLTNGSTYVPGESVTVSFKTPPGVGFPTDYIIQAGGATFTNGYCSNSRVGYSIEYPGGPGTQNFGVYTAAQTATLTMPKSGLVTVFASWGVQFGLMYLTKPIYLQPAAASSSSSTPSNSPSGGVTTGSSAVPSAVWTTAPSTSPSSAPSTSLPSFFQSSNNPSFLPSLAPTTTPSSNPLTILASSSSPSTSPSTSTSPTATSTAPPITSSPSSSIPSLSPSLSSTSSNPTFAHTTSPSNGPSVQAKSASPTDPTPSNEPTPEPITRAPRRTRHPTYPHTAAPSSLPKKRPRHN